MSFVWCIVVRRDDVAQVEDLAASADVAKAEVLNWFPDRYRPKPGRELECFLRALRIGKVTKQQTEVSQMAGEIRGAIELLATELPKMLVRRTSSPSSLFTDDEYCRLSILAGAALDAHGIVQGHKHPHKMQLWHNDAQLFEWHARALLTAAGMTEVGDGDESPAIRIVGHSLEAVGEGRHSPDAIGKALRRHSKKTIDLPSAAQVGSLGYIMVA
ncbi:hypothetical protein [Acidisphaera sp. S103]|uniref:hypothetical protein n=1 Tax=Acidisphaera sp. S103 TaxID=1747223 RepID=UPI00131E309E|nr:hypothetical protein [Acidisphaera sp. S103]